MKHNRKWLALALTGAMTLSLLVGCAGNQNTGGNQGASSDTLVIAEQGMFSAGGTVISSDGTFDVSNYYTSRKGSTFMWTMPMCSTRSRRTPLGCPWCFSTAMVSPAWDG